MFRWASCGLVVLLVALIAVPVAAQKPLPAVPAGPLPIPSDPGLPIPGGKPSRPVYTLPGPPKTDRHGDALPSGAVVRYGSVRLRHGADVFAMAFSHDGKRLCTVSGSEDSVKLWDTATGREVARLNTTATLVGLAKDGSVVLVDEANAGISVWIPETNKVRALPEKTLPEGTNPSALAVNPDSRSCAVASNGEVLIIDLQNGKTLKTLNLPGNQPKGANAANAPPAPNPNIVPATKLMYSPDGRWLVGNGPKTGVWMWDLRTGKRVRTYRSDAEMPDYTFSPDITKLVVTSNDRLLTYGLDSEESSDTFKSPQGTAMYAPRYSDDGKLLFVFFNDGTVQPLDAKTGEEKEAYDPPEMNIRNPFAFAPGGTMAAAIDQTGGIRIWEPATGKGPEVTRLPVLSDPGITSSGKSVFVLDQTNKAHTFDLATGAPGKAIELPTDDSGLGPTLDPVFRRAALIVESGEELELRVYDLDADKVVAKYSVPQADGVPFVSFARANKERMALFCPTKLVILNPVTGKVVRSIPIGPGADGARGVIAPDGRTVAACARTITIWEIASGKKRMTIDAGLNVEQIAFSADSRWLVASESGGNAVVVDLRTGTVTRRIQTPDPNEGFCAIALSSDGKRVAAGSPQGRVTVWDVSSGETLAPFAGHDGVVTGLAFTEDGKKLVSTSQDGTALVWEIPDKPLSLTPVEAAVGSFDEAFKLLSSADGVPAQRALDYMYRHTADAVKQLSERMKAPAGTPPAKLAQWVADLESDEYATRTAAMKELEKVGGEAADLLKQTAAKSASPEARKLAKELLGKLDSAVVRTDDVTAARAVEFLENAGTPEARALLEKWAAGPPGHRLTVEAGIAVARKKPGGK